MVYAPNVAVPPITCNQSILQRLLECAQPSELTCLLLLLTSEAPVERLYRRYDSVQLFFAIYLKVLLAFAGKKYI